MKLEKIAINELSLDPANVRKHDRRNLDAIKASLRKFGQQKPIVVDSRGIVLAGNGTLTAAKELGWSEIQITRTTLSGVDATAFAIADNRTAELAQWEDSLSDVLKSLADADVDLGELGFTPKEIEELNQSGLSDKYTHKIDAPVYQPKGIKPEVTDLLNTKRRDEFVEKINAADIEEKLKGFLRNAAQRHVVFDYGKIAEFYCHADKQTQELMEEMALVIIDFNKALANGYVRLNENILATLEQSGEKALEPDND
jgi:hypothetical protein